MPTVLILRGFRFFFVSLDRGEPVHIHIEKGDAYAKYWLKPIRLARSKGFKASEISQIRGIIEKHQGIFIKRWDEFFA
jgi:Domain of unknown function (DUF4160)